MLTARLKLPAPSGLDILIASAFVVLAQLEVTFWYSGPDPVWARLLWLGVGAAALWRSRFPVAFAVAVWVLVLLVAVPQSLIPEYSAAFSIAVTLPVFGLGCYAPNARRAIILGAAGVLVSSALFVFLDLANLGSGNKSAMQWSRTIATFVFAAAAGVALRDRTVSLAAARERLAALPPETTAVAAALVRARDTISRELHAIVVVCLGRIRDSLAAAGNAIASGAPATLPLRSARQASQEAMDEMRRMLSLLRSPERPLAAAPETAPVPAPIVDTAAGLHIGPPPRNPDRPSWPDWKEWESWPLARFLRRQGLVVLLFVNGISFAIAAELSDPEVGETAFVLRLLGATALALVFVPRRTWPALTTFGVAAIVFGRAYLFGDLYPLDLPLWIAAFVAGAYMGRIWLAAVGLLVLAGTSVAVVLHLEPGVPASPGIAFNLTMAAAWVVGLAGRRRLEQATELDRITAEEQRRRNQAAGRAVEEERLRVARELHDLVGHGLTTITLQCAAAERMPSTGSTDIAAVLETVDGIVDTVSDELDLLLEALQGNGGESAPTIAAIPELVARAEAPEGASGPARASGLQIDLETVGELGDVPGGPGAAAYRIIQESLANAGKHGAGGPVRVSVTRTAERLDLSVTNPVEPFDSNAGPAPGFGLGTLGIRERAGIYKGTVETGIDESGLWRVYVSLPLEPARTKPLS